MQNSETTTTVGPTSTDDDAYAKTDELEAALKSEGCAFTVTPVLPVGTDRGRSQGRTDSGASPRDDFALASRVAKEVFDKEVIYVTAAERKIFMALKISSTDPNFLSAQRVYRVTMALVKILVEKGVLPPSVAQLEPPKLEEPKPEPFNGILDCRPKTIYRAFRVIEGGQSAEKSDAAPGVKPEHEDDR